MYLNYNYEFILDKMEFYKHIYNKHEQELVRYNDRQSMFICCNPVDQKIGFV